MRALILTLLLLPGAALADFARISDEGEFRQTVQGRDLVMRVWGVEVQVNGDGTITGAAQGWDVGGRWSWIDGLFCRSLTWGEDDLGDNCQAVARDGDLIRFTSDGGAGRSATLRIQ
ncbi:MAG: dihydrodipicolinate reductase [Paracoccaceae bacterium]